MTGALALGIATPVAALPIVFGKYAPGVVIDLEIRRSFVEWPWRHGVGIHDGKGFRFVEFKPERYHK